MKDLSLFISTATFVVLLGFITYKGLQVPLKTDSITDEEVATEKIGNEEVEDTLPPLPITSLDLPVNISFAGEPVPLNIPDVYERFDK